jgi:protein TonB
VKTPSATQPIPSHGTPLREFVPPAAKQAPGPIQSAALPLPPGTEPIISAQTIPGLPADLTRPVPPPAAPPQPAVATPAPAPQPVLPPGGKFEAAQLITRKLPAYPSVARQLGLYGAVRMEAVIDERGAVKSVKVLSGEAILATEAKNAVVTWKYKPATLNGKPIASNAEIEIVFGDRNK